MPQVEISWNYSPTEKKRNDKPKWEHEGAEEKDSYWAGLMEPKDDSPGGPFVPQQQNSPEMDLSSLIGHKHVAKLRLSLRQCSHVSKPQHIKRINTHTHRHTFQ